MARPHSEPKHWLDIGSDYHGGETDKKALAEKYHVSLSHVRNALKFYKHTLKDMVEDMVENWREAGGTGFWDWSPKPSDELRYRIIGLLPSGRSGGAREARTLRRGRPQSEPKHWLDIGYDHHGGETDKKALAEKYDVSLRHVGNALAFYNQAFQEMVRDWPPEAGTEYWGLEKPSYKLKRKIIGLICAANK